MRPYVKFLRGIALVGQLGFTLITPTVAMALLGQWLQSRFGLGTWVMVLALLVGLTTSGMSGYNICRRAIASAQKKDKAQEKKSVVFYRHE